MAEPRFCELCGVLTPEPQVVDGKFYCPKCAVRLESGASKSRLEDASLYDRVPGTPPEKMKFRCLGCNALLSVTTVSKRSKLTCPQCKTGMYIEPDGSVEPMHKAAQPASQQKGGASDEAPPIFDKKELDKMLNMDVQEKRGIASSEETVDIPSSTLPPSQLRKREGGTGEIPPTRGIQKPKRQLPKLKIQPRSRLDQYKKIAAGLPATEENKPLLIIAVVLLVLPGIFALIVIHSDLGKGLRKKLTSPADTLRESAKRIMESIGSAPVSGGGEEEEETTTEEEASPEENNEETFPKEEVEKKSAAQPEGEEEKKTEEPSKTGKSEEPTTPEEKKPEEGEGEKEDSTPETPPKTE